MYIYVYIYIYIYVYLLLNICVYMWVNPSSGSALTCAAKFAFDAADDATVGGKPLADTVLATPTAPPCRMKNNGAGEVRLRA